MAPLAGRCWGRLQNGVVVSGMDGRSDTASAQIRRILSTWALSDGTVVVIEEQPPSRQTREWDQHHYVLTHFEGDRVVERRYTTSMDLLSLIAEGMVFEHQRRSSAGSSL